MIDFKNAKKFLAYSFEDVYDKYAKYSLELAKLKGLWLEFGVASGDTTRKYIESMPKDLKPIYGFDSFFGIPESWAGHDIGKFSTNGIAPIIEDAEMVIGLFNDTLPDFIKTHNEQISVLIIDCDLYSSTKTIFDNCKKNIVKGTIILFDEIHNGDGIYSDWENHAYIAFMEFAKENNAEFEWVAYVSNGEQASCIITNIDNK